MFICIMLKMMAVAVMPNMMVIMTVTKIITTNINMTVVLIAASSMPVLVFFITTTFPFVSNRVYLTCYVSITTSIVMYHRSTCNKYGVTEANSTHLISSHAISHTVKP